MIKVTPSMRKDARENIQRKPISMLSPKLPNKVKSGLCPTCDDFIENFRDEQSVREYYISGMCQECQDKTFGK